MYDKFEEVMQYSWYNQINMMITMTIIHQNTNIDRTDHVLL